MYCLIWRIVFALNTDESPSTLMTLNFSWMASLSNSLLRSSKYSIKPAVSFSDRWPHRYVQIDRNNPNAAIFNSGNGFLQKSWTKVNWFVPVKLENQYSVIEEIWLFGGWSSSGRNNISRQLRARVCNGIGKLWIDLPMSFNVSFNLLE